MAPRKAITSEAATIGNNVVEGVNPPRPLTRSTLMELPALHQVTPILTDLH